MHVCVCVCVCVYDKYIYIYMYVYIYKYIYICSEGSGWLNIQVYIYIYIHICCEGSGWLNIQIDRQIDRQIYAVVDKVCLGTRGVAPLLLKLQRLVYAPLSYQCMRPDATSICGLNNLAFALEEPLPLKLQRLKRCEIVAVHKRECALHLCLATRRKLIKRFFFWSVFVHLLYQ